MKVNIVTRNIGPWHDPYSSQLVSVTGDNGNTPLWHSDGLGRERVTLLSGDTEVRELEWSTSGAVAARCNDTKARILARRHTGVDFDMAVEQFYRSYRPDPMGPASRYI